MKRMWEIPAEPAIANTSLIGITFNSGGYAVNNKLTNQTLFRVTMSLAALICVCAANAQAQTNSSEHSGVIYRNPRVYNIEYSFEMFPDPNKTESTKDLKLWVEVRLFSLCGFVEQGRALFFESTLLSVLPQPTRAGLVHGTTN